GVHDRRGVTDRRGGSGRMGRTPSRERDGYGPVYTPAPPVGPTEGRYLPGMRGPTGAARTVEITGILWGGDRGLSRGEVLDNRTLQPVARMNLEDVRRMGLRSGDLLSGRAEERGGRRIVVAVEAVNDRQPEEVRERPLFEQLTASFPDRRIRLEHGQQ